MCAAIYPGATPKWRNGAKKIVISVDGDQFIIPLPEISDFSLEDEATRADLRTILYKYVRLHSACANELSDKLRAFLQEPPQ